MDHIFKIAKQLIKDNQDVVGDKCVKDDSGNLRGLKLLDHAMKGIERVIEKIIRERISIDDMQFGFMPGRGTTDAIFIL